ncbi:MAG TPA: HAMP domain-containing sensor histidine kinase [Solirubrobacteraceae bacterium]|nr:HAMP domain-containing sensor histidine kinase [Solirubrobacteraceae bacterium]
MSRGWPQTLRFRLVLAAAGSILVALVLFGTATVLLVSHELRSSLDSALRQRAQDVAELAVSAPAVLNSPGALESPVSGRSIAVEVIDARGRILARSLTLGAGLLPEDRLATAARVSGATGFENIELDGRPFRLFAAPIALSGPAGGGAVLVASDTSDISHTTARLGVLVILIGAGAALLAALLAAVLTGRGLRPLRRLAVGAGEIERTADPSRRLPAREVADEIGQLTGVLNRMLSSLEASRAGERRFLADASHELRTPVTTLLGNVEFAARHGADPDVLEELQRDARRLARLVDDLLALERVDAGVAGDEEVDLGAVVRGVVGAHAGSEEDRERVSSVGADHAFVRGDEGALTRAVENLVENALVHGPDGGRVTISVSRSNGSARVTVSDEGPGPDPADRDRLFERFWRGAGASGRPGSGLGLSIVSAIVDRHGGRIVVNGSAFTLELPAVEVGQAEAFRPEGRGRGPSGEDAGSDA